MWTVISDLHLFSHRSRAHVHRQFIVEAARQSEVLVLNGDIFDFHWSIFGELEATMDAAEAWLRALAAECPRCRIHYLLGNHDAVLPWADRCASIAGDVENLDWSPDYLRLGNTLFTHGDLLLGRGPRRTRELDPDARLRRRSLGRAYAVISGLRILRAASLLPSNRRTSRMIHRNFLQLGPELTEGVRRLCTGHTHRPFSGIRIHGLELHNTGSTVAGMAFRPLMLRDPHDSEVDRGA